VLRTLLRSAAALAGLITLWVVALPLSADAETTDGTLTVIVDRDVDGNGNYSSVDVPQRDIEISVTDASGSPSVKGVTGTDGKFVLEPTSKLTGGRYFVVAEIPSTLSDLTPVPESSTFQPLSTTVDVTSDNQTVRMGVATGHTTSSQSPDPHSTSVSRGSERPEAAVRFAVGDLVWRDDNRSGTQDEGELPASRISVQLLNADGDVVATRLSSPSGHYIFDNVRAGTYSVRFAGVPEGFRLTRAGAAEDHTSDSDPDYSGVTPSFTLGVGEPNVRASAAADGVQAAYINPTIDAGITPLRYAVGDHVWLDVNSDGIQQPDEPAASATVALLTATGNVVATTATDATGHYQFSNLRAGSYKLQFTHLPPNRALTVRAAGSDPAQDSQADPDNGTTPVFDLKQGAPDLVPVTDGNASSIDFDNETLNAGLVVSYSIEDRVWLDNNGDGVLDPGDSGLPGVKVELLGSASELLATAVTSKTGTYNFDRLPAGTYRIRFCKPPHGLIFTSQDAGNDPATDSDADQHGLTAKFPLGNDGPADPSLDAGLTTPANYRAARHSDKSPVTMALSTTSGLAPQIPIVVLALAALAGTSCVLIARRRRHRLNQ
jgi:hypothetical protein